MVERKLIPKSKCFTRRGITRKVIDFEGEELDIELKVLTNHESDELMSEFTDLDSGDTDLDMPGLIQARILRTLIDLNVDFGEGRTWKDLDEEERIQVLDEIDPKLRERISKEAMGINTLNQEEKGFLRKQS
ncbi:MAG: hypothetical protein WC109_01685 [Syntrophomonadaceae bacterium]